MSKCLHTRIFLTVLYLVLVSLLTIEGSCPTGHYCPTEGEQIPCPRGFINPNTGSTDWTACQPCPGGQYCATEGLASPTGSCTAGYFCSGADITPTPASKRCWLRSFCPAGSSEPEACALNTYNYDYGQVECHECPVGHFCIAKELIGKCYEGYHCLPQAFVANQTACTPGSYCTNGLKRPCPQGTMQPYAGMNECQQCPEGKYCAVGGLTTYTGSCSGGYWCDLGSIWSTPEGQSCPPGHRCPEGFKTACGAGSYQRYSWRQHCLVCPAGFYCGLEATVNPAPCAEGQCCHEGFIEPTSCHQGEFLHLTYEPANRLTFVEASALCVAQGPYQLAVIDTSEEFDRLMAWFLETSTYVTGGTLNLPDGVWLGAYWDASTSYKWNMCFDSVTLTWGDWATGQDPTPDTQQCLILNQNRKFENVNCGDRHDILCETCSDCDAGNYYNNDAGACEPCPSGMYCSRKGLLAPSGSCADGYHCSQGGAVSPHQEPCSPGSYCSGGFKTECPAGFYQPQARSVECLLCPPGSLCKETGLQYPNGLCDEGYYCPAGSIDTYNEGIICPIGHRCPTGSGVPIPCESGWFQGDAGMGYCMPCQQFTYCNQNDAIAEKQSGPDSPTHGVVVPKVCPPLVDCEGGNTFSLTHGMAAGELYVKSIDCYSDPFVPGELNLELSCTPLCDGVAVSSQEEIIFTVSCPGCLADMTSVTWSIRECYLEILHQCHICYRRIHYIDNQNTASFTYSRKWSRFDTTGWQFFTTFAKVETSDGKEGMVYSIWSTFDPYTGPVDCTVTPNNGQPMDTLFSINCDPVPGQSGFTLTYHLSVYDVEIFQGTTAMTGLQLPEARPEDNFDLPLHLEARFNTQLFYKTDFTVKIYPPVDGALSDWSAWSGCSVSCGPGSWTRLRDCTNPAPAYGGADCVGATSQTADCNVAECPIDGGYTAWTSWTSCTLTCGTGGQTRTRECTNPVPQYGGADCVGEPTATQDCNTNPCPIDGGLTEWSVWDGCTKSCDSGTQTKTRDCTDPTPQYGGADCIGILSDSQACNTQPCPIDGGFNIWTEWGTCSLTCGTGSRSRSRECTNPVPQYGGADCVGEPTSTQDCNTNPCPIDGGLTEWSVWDGCTKSCDSGTQTKTRDCTDPTPQYGGADCIGILSDSQACNTQPCPIDGGFTIWTEWGTCSLTCGTGSRSRSRECTNPVPQYGGADCVGEPTSTQDCNTNPCPIDGGFTLWIGWGTCSLTCGTGSQSRSRDCTNPIPQHGGAYCVGDITQSQDCLLIMCAVDGQYSDWSQWDTCTKSCDTGSQTRTRECDDPAPQYGGLDCVGNPTDMQNCNVDPCPIDGGLTEWGSWGTCTQTCGTGSRTRSRDCTNPSPQYGGANCLGDTLDSEGCNSNLCPGDEAFTDWSAWSACSESCGLGSWSRSRVCSNGGTDCVGDTTQTADCNVAACPIDGGYTAWTSWTSCTLTCGTGGQTRTRECTNPVPQYGGADCVGEPTSTQDCNTNPCPIDGGFTEWSVWDGCTKSCASGTQTKTRECTDPTPQYGGADCIGILSDSQACNTQPCPIDGGFTIWTGWGTCSLTCGTGSHSRSRDCTNPIPQHGGAYCVGDITQSQDCLLIMCAVDGQYSDWSQWDTCTKSCDTGSQTRTRECDDPSPQYGGLDCVGNPTDMQNCNVDPCPIDGGLTEWGSWGTCTQTCGTGSRTRSRHCTNPSPQYGGANCLEDTLDSEDCNSNLCPGDEAFTDWSAWSACSESCGLGSWSRSRACSNGGADCVGDTSQTADCNVAVCPIDGGYTAWTSWTSCTLTCGTGGQTRTRECTNPVPQYGGANCVGEPTSTQDCNIDPCPIDGSFTEWSAWDGCTKSCESGTQTRTRDCIDTTPHYGGPHCIGTLSDSQVCNTQPCPIQGGFTEWGSWGMCTQTCGTGSRTRSRDCTNPSPQYGGADCLGDTLDSEDCNSNICLDSYDPGEVKVTFSCLPKCTSLMSSAVDILIGLECDACRTSTVKYTWTLRRCTNYSVGSCDHSMDNIHYIHNSLNTYTYRTAELVFLVSGWPHLGMFLKVELEDGNSGMTYHIWKFFDPPPSPPSCNTEPPSGLCISTQFSVTCEDVFIPVGVNISYSLYNDHSLLVLLYKGDTPHASNLLLPAGFQDGQNNLHLYMVARIQGHRFYLTQTTVQVTCELVSLEEIMGGTAGDSQSSGEAGASAIDQQIQEGDLYGAIQKLGVAVNIMNSQTNRTQEDNNNTTTPVDNGEPDHGNETYTNQQLTEYRTQVINSVSKINISDYHLVSSVCSVLNQVTEVKEQLSEEAKEVATETYSNLAEGLIESLDNTEEDIAMDEVTSTARAILQGAGAMIGVLTDSLGAVYTREDGEDMGVSTTPKPSTVSQNVPREIEMTNTLLKSVDNVCNALLNIQIQDVQETVIETMQVQVAVKKVSPSRLPGLRLELESPVPFTEGMKKISTVTIPDDIVLPVETSNFRFHIVVLERNPYQRSKATESIRTPVVSVTLKDSHQNVVNLENLQQPIKLSLPTDIDSTKATGHLGLNVSIYKDTDGLSLLSDKSYSSMASFRLLKSDKIVGLKLTPPTNLTSLRVYISNNRAPAFQDIMEEGKLYPQDFLSFFEEFSGYLAADITITPSMNSNRSIIHFAGGDKTQGVSESYVGVSLDLSNNDTVMVVRDLDPECLGNATLAACEGRLEMEVEFRTFTMQCMYWQEATESWSGSGCWLSTDTTDTILGCECDHLSVFGGSILPAPFEMNPDYDLMLLDTIFNNPIVITVVIMIWVIYMFLALWAREADRRDREKNGVIRCGSSDKQAIQEYLVCVLTGWWPEAGTTANVFFCIEGTLGKSRKVCLTSNKERLQTGYEDWFQLKTEHSLGNLRAVSLWHDNSGTSPHWFLNQVFVKDVHRGESWLFVFSDWLAFDRGHLRQTSVTLDYITEEELRYRQKQHFFVKTTEDLRDRHIWLSIFSKPARSSFSRVQRLTCCLSILLTTMLADLMLCGIPKDNPNDEVSTGAFKLSGSQFAIGIQSSLMVFPINLIIIQGFLQSKPSPSQNHAQCSTLKHRSKFSGPKDQGKSLGDMAWYKRDQNFPIFRSLSIPSDWSSDCLSKQSEYSDSSSKQSEYFSCHASLDTLLDDLAGSEYEWFEDRDSGPMEDNSVNRTSGSEMSLGVKHLPHWCVYIAWAVVIATCVLCSYLVLLYGLKYSYTHSLDWLMAFVIGFLSSTLIQEPVKAVAVAAFLTFILKKTVQFQDVEPTIEDDREVEFETIMSSREPKHTYMKPLSKKVWWRQVRPILQLDGMMDLTMKNLKVQAMYVTLLLVIINSHRPVDTAYMSAVTIRNLFIDNNDHMQLAQVKTLGTFYRYLHETLVPGMETVTHRGKREATLGSDLYLIGSYRLRQLRIKKDTSCPYVTKQLIPEGCDAGYGTSQQDTQDYDIGWVPASSSDNATWPYSRTSMLNALSFPGELATYPGSGYVVNIPVKSMERGEIIDVFSSLEESGWIDVRTRAVFVEFSLYNPNVDLFYVVVVLFENFNLGSVSPIHRIYTHSIFQYRDISEKFVYFCEVLFVLLNMMLTYIQLIKLFRDGIKTYFSDVWNIVELIQIVLSFTTVGMSSHRYTTVLRVLSEIKKQDAETYINMYPLVSTDLFIEYLNASLLVLLMFKATRLLQLHPRLRVIARTLSSARSALFHFSFIIFVVFLAYSHASFLFFHKVLHHYRAFGSTVVTNVGLLLGNGEMIDMAENYNFLGTFFIVMFVVSLNFCLVTMYAAILNIGLMYVRDKKRNENEMLLNERIIYRMKRILGLE